jgi:murein DD-endopeptidase MepM/ murein hydrolase activator NlpD
MYKVRVLISSYCALIIKDYKRTPGQRPFSIPARIRRWRVRMRRLPFRFLLAGTGVGGLLVILMPTPDTAFDIERSDFVRPTQDANAREEDRLTKRLPFPRQSIGAVAPDREGSSHSLPKREMKAERANDKLVNSPSSRLTHHNITVAPGDSLYTIFNRLGLPQSELQRVLATAQEAKRLARIHEGQPLELDVAPDNTLVTLLLRLDPVQALRITRDNDTFRSELVTEKADRRVATATGAISSSLFLAGKDAGLSDKLIMEMVDIFAWDIDFVLDIRAGDRFTVLYEELFKHGEKLHDGAILAAEFENRGRIIRALRYSDGLGQTGYFTPDGRSMRKAFLRTPVKFSRISSSFTLHRWHPVLHRFRAHRGVDYAAPTGTPVKATGQGKIVHKGRKGGYGRTIAVQHGSRYTTLYAHLSGYAKGIHQGVDVRQGQVIGYVGHSGLATGPHLHYEFRVDGVHRNPLTVRLPQAAPIPAESRADFLAKAEPLVAQLDKLARIALAQNGPVGASR